MGIIVGKNGNKNVSEIWAGLSGKNVRLLEIYSGTSEGVNKLIYQLHDESTPEQDIVKVNDLDKYGFDCYICGICGYEFGSITQADIAGGFFESACPSCNNTIGENYGVIPKYYFKCGTCDQKVLDNVSSDDAVGYVQANCPRCNHTCFGTF